MYHNKIDYARLLSVGLIIIAAILVFKSFVESKHNSSRQQYIQECTTKSNLHESDCFYLYEKSK